MEKSYEQWNGKKYPVRVVKLPYEGEVNVADYDLWQAIEDEYNKGNKEAIELDGDIYYYCKTGFIAVTVKV